MSNTCFLLCLSNLCICVLEMDDVLENTMTQLVSPVVLIVPVEHTMTQLAVRQRVIAKIVPAEHTMTKLAVRQWLIAKFVESGSEIRHVCSSVVVKLANNYIERQFVT